MDNFDMTVDMSCPECGGQLRGFINAIPSTADDVGYACDGCDRSWTVDEWEAVEYNE